MKRKQTQLTLIVFTIFALMLAACTTAEPTPTVAPAATQVAEPTEAPAPTEVPTEVPEPTEEMMEEEEMMETIVDIAVANEDFSTLVTALSAANLVETLQGEGPFTVFAPTNDAFATLGEETMSALLEDTDALSDILLYHVVSGKVLAEDVVGLDSATTIQGEDITITVTDGMVMVNDATVVTTDIEGSNGVIHVIDAVILPPSLVETEAPELPNIVETAISAGSFETLVAAVEAAGLAETLQGDGPFTVFAPTDEAFAALGEETINTLLDDPETLGGILLYHVVPGEYYAKDVVELTAAETAQGSPVLFTVTDDGVQVNNANIVMTDIETSNGVIHVLDAVITPPTETIVDIAVNNGSFNTLVAALEAADLVEVLQGEGPFTVFAPTDEAFAQVEGLDTIIADTDLLTSILLYHVVDGAVFAGDVAGLETAATINGEEVTITVDEEGNVFINDAQVIITDILATNGVIHVIDAVLVPAG